MTARSCRRCGVRLSLLNAVRWKGARDGFESRCRRCHARRQRERYWRSPEHYRAVSRERRRAQSAEAAQ